MIVVITNFVMELRSAALDQLSSVHKPHYELVSISISFVWKWKNTTPWLYYPLNGHHKPFGDFKDMIRLGCAMRQCIFATINIYFVH